MASSNAFPFPSQPAWSWQGLNDARRAVDTADPRMEVQPADPGDRMPNLGYGPGYNFGLVPAQFQQQAPGANQLLQPDVQSGTAPPQNRLAPWSNFDADMSFDDYWREQARALAANPNDYGKAEQLPGITSGAAPKPWGLNRDQPTWNERPAYGPGGRSGGFVGTLQRIRPIQEGIDPGISIGDEAIPGTRSGTPVIMQQRPGWKYRET